MLLQSPTVLVLTQCGPNLLLPRRPLQMHLTVVGHQVEILDRLVYGTFRLDFHHFDHFELD